MYVCDIFSINSIGAIQRYFESRRRNWRESTDQSQQDRVAKQSKCRRVRSRRLRVSHDYI